MDVNNFPDTHDTSNNILQYRQTDTKQQSEPDDRME
jgi:hypothetical protein